MQVLQRDAFERLDLKQLLLQPEMLEAIQPDIHLVSQLIIGLRGLMGGRGEGLGAASWCGAWWKN